MFSSRVWPVCLHIIIIRDLWLKRGPLLFTLLGILSHLPQWLTTLRTSGNAPRRMDQIAHGSDFAPCLGWSVHHAAAALPVPHLPATHLYRIQTHRFSRTYAAYGAAAGWTMRDVAHLPNYPSTPHQRIQCPTSTASETVSFDCTATSKASETVVAPAVSQLAPTPHWRQ